ncbi:MAG TPA: superinfection immunity protein [Devosiaceae bacterium]
MIRKRMFGGAGLMALVATTPVLAQTAPVGPHAPGVFGIVFFVLALLLYFLPTWTALWRRHDKKWLVVLANLLLGWTVIGWVAVLVWSLAGAARGTNAAANSTPPPIQ